MIDFLIWEKRLVCFEFYYCGGPVKSPVFIVVGVFKSIFIQELLD